MVWSNRAAVPSLVRGGRYGGYADIVPSATSKRDLSRSRSAKWVRSCWRSCHSSAMPVDPLPRAEARSAAKAGACPALSNQPGTQASYLGWQERPRDGDDRGDVEDAAGQQVEDHPGEREELASQADIEQAGQGSEGERDGKPGSKGPKLSAIVIVVMRRTRNDIRMKLRMVTLRRPAAMPARPKSRSR